MLKVVRALAGSALASAVLLGPAFAVPVLQITVNGQAYDITLTQGGFNDVNGGDVGTGGVLEGQPWWIDQAGSSGAASDLAVDFRDAWYNAAIAQGSVLQSDESYLFAYEENSNGSNINTQAVRWDGSTHILAVAGPGKTQSLGTAIGDLYYASAVAVPEVDGPVAAQAAFILGAFLLWRRGRRRSFNSA